MTQQLTLHHSFRVRGGAKADKLWEMLHTLGLEDGAEEWDHPEIEFVTQEDAKPHPGAIVIYIAAADEGNNALGICHYYHWEGPIIVDATGEQYDLQIRCLRRWLFDQN